MPKSKQPVPLQKLAFDSLVGHCALYCDAISNEGRLNGLRQSVALIKQCLIDQMPRTFYPEFCRKFLLKFHSLGLRESRSIDRPASHQKAALEIMMDVEMVGLTCGDYSLRYLDPLDAHRIHGLRVLEREETEEDYVPMGLENYRLQDLTTFTYPMGCTDHELEILGSRCLKLEILDIHESEKVTDRGLRALRPCSKLRIFDLRDCGVTRDGVNEMLSFHRNLEQFEFAEYTGDDSNIFHVLACPKSLVCPSIKRFTVKGDYGEDEYLPSLVALFPNLTRLEFRCVSGNDFGSLSVLGNLKNLKEIHFFEECFFLERVKEFLTSFGGNITRLTLRWINVSVTQNDLNFILKTCGNLEWLDISYRPAGHDEKYVIPPFKKLKYLACFADICWTDYRVELELGEMLSLEILEVNNFNAIYEMVELMVLDNVKFPNLREVRKCVTTNQYSKNHVRNRILEIVKNNNIDFSLICFCNTCTIFAFF